MSKSKVYFTDFRCPVGTSIQDKLKRLCLAAGIKDIDMENKFVAIKMHFGELGNLAFLRPQYAKTVADLVKAQGGRPFLTDCNTLYPGSRKHALEHMDCANLNGFNPITTGCQIIIGDGLKGTDDVEVPVRNGEFCKTAKIGRAVMDADVFISLAHFKGHEQTGFGGALKNIGMGCGSRAGKEEMHSSGKPVVDQDKCIGCGKCVENCAHNGPHIENGKCTILKYKCTGCGRCINVCPMHAIHADYAIANELLNCKIAEYAKAVVDGRPSFHIALALDVSPCCDCHNFSDVPIVPNVGMFASFDPVALDTACADMINAQTVNPNSVIAHEHDHPHDHFTAAHPDTDWRAAVEHGEAIGLGTTHYELIEV